MRTTVLVLTLLASAVLVASPGPPEAEAPPPSETSGIPPGAVLREYDAGAAYPGPRGVRRVVVPQGNLILPHRPLVPGDLMVIAPFGSGPVGSDGQPSGDPSVLGPSPEDLALPDLLLDRIRSFLRAEALLADPDEQVCLDGTTLSVLATPAEHERIAACLQPLTTASEPIGIEAVLAPVEVLDTACPGWRAAGPDGLPAEALEAALADPRSRFASLEARSGEVVASGGRTIEVFHAQSEVNQTGVLPVANPLLVAPMAGFRLEVLPVRTSIAGRVWLDLRAGSFLPEAEERIAGDEWGSFDFPRVDETLVATRLVATTGRAIVAAVVGDGDPPCALVVRVSVRASAGPPAGSDGDRIAVHHLAPLLARARRFPWPFADGDAEGGDVVAQGMAQSELERLESLLEGLVAGDGGDGPEGGGSSCIGLGGRLLVAGPPAAHAVVETALRREAEERTRMAAIEIVVLEAPAPALASVRGLAEGGPGGGILRQGWEEAVRDLDDVRIRRFGVRGCHRTVHAVRRAAVRTFLTEYFCISGGTGFGIIERALPEVDSCADGAELRVRADLGGDAASPGKTARLQVEGAVAAILDERDVPVPYSLADLAGGTGTSGAGSAGGGAKAAWRSGVAYLTLPRQRLTRWDLERRVPLGRHVILQAESGEAGAVVLIGRVTAE